MPKNMPKTYLDFNLNIQYIKDEGGVSYGSGKEK